ncbi:EF-hand [Boletus edulis]|nr:EF-hand [Boletus edulis]
MSYYDASQGAHRSHSHSHSHHHHHTGSGYVTPVGADPQLWQYFSAVDTNRSGALSINELQHALHNGNWSRFDLDTVKMLVNMFDTNRTGTIGFNEFSRLWQYISEWQRVFKHFDRDHSGTIERRELSDALRNFGYDLSPSLLTLIEYKYASGATAAYGPPPGITFDRFVRACVTVKTLTEAFQSFDPHREGWARFSYEDFMKVITTLT